MTKRSLDVSVNTVSKQSKHWSCGLLESMKDPKSIYKETDKVVVIKDKYPKANFHYLVLPREDIKSIFQLNRTHIKLIEYFGEIYDIIKSEHRNCELLAGFHSVPSMQRLHMHIISRDMISICLKTKIHWNSFTTDFFINYKDFLERLKEDGAIKKISRETHKALLATPLKCNQCDFKPKNMPDLKQHLQSHAK